MKPQMERPATEAQMIPGPDMQSTVALQELSYFLQYLWMAPRLFKKPRHPKALLSLLTKDTVGKPAKQRMG